MPPPPNKPARQTIRPSMPSAGVLYSANNATLTNTALNSSAHNRTTSIGFGGGSSLNANSVLQARIAEKKAELENLKQLKELSGELAGQMQMLEEKLGTLRDGTEAVGLVLGNWEGVLRAIGLAAGRFSDMQWDCCMNGLRCLRGVEADYGVAAVPQAKDAAQAEETPLPQTLVRIPVQEMDQMRAKDAGE